MKIFRNVTENKNGKTLTADVKSQIKIVTLTQLSFIHSNFEYQIPSRDLLRILSRGPPSK